MDPPIESEDDLGGLELRPGLDPVRGFRVQGIIGPVMLRVAPLEFFFYGYLTIGGSKIGLSEGGSFGLTFRFLSYHYPYFLSYIARSAGMSVVRLTR